MASPGLVWCIDDVPGIRRRGRRTVRYVDERTGAEVRDPEELARFRHLAVPPAWTDVWISPDPTTHVQATGRDARGRKQYRYHPSFRASREATKFGQLVPFGHALDHLRAAVEHDLARPGVPYERVVALVVSLLEKTFVRVGNEEYARSNGTYGLTTLRDQHAVPERQGLRLRFPGKAGRRHDLHLGDRRLARLVKRCQDLPGQLLFQYEADDGALLPVRSGDVNEYLRTHTGLDATAKTYRTWGATLLAAVGLSALEPPPTAGEARVAVSATLDAVARALGNTPAVARRSYVHPVVIDLYTQGALAGRWRDGPARSKGRLLVEERRLLNVLEGNRPRRPRAAGDASRHRAESRARRV